MKIHTMEYQKIGHYKYRLAKDYRINTGIMPSAHNDYISLDKGILIVKKHYAWDGSSWSFDKNSIVASLVHDALYQLMRERLLNKKHRQAADLLYRDICIACGLWKIHANFRYKMLRMFGKGAVKTKRRPNKSLLAP